jgi:nucleoside-diphosphate-sugar epimerase
VSQYSGVIPKFITAMLRGEAPVIYGDGMQSRDFMYVANIVKANLWACERKEAVGHVINIASGESYTLLDLYRNLSSIIGSTTDPIFTDARIGDIKHSFASIELAKSKLGYIREINWLTGLRKTVEWYSTRN